MLLLYVIMNPNMLLAKCMTNIITMSPKYFFRMIFGMGLVSRPDPGRRQKKI